MLSHISASKREQTSKAEWIRELIAVGLLPVFTTLDSASDGYRASKKELAEIERRHATGLLTNMNGLPTKATVQFSIVVPVEVYEIARVQALKEKKSLRVFCGEVISKFVNRKKKP